MTAKRFGDCSVATLGLGVNAQYGDLGRDNRALYADHDGELMAGLRFDNAVAIVTGAGRGLGREYALELARRGARVVVNDLAADRPGEQDPAQEVVDSIAAAGGEAVASLGSVATPEGGQSIVDAALKAFGRVDVLVNNAGIVRPELFSELDLDTLRSVIDVHLMGSFYVAQPAFRLMAKQGSGSIINTVSSAVFGAPQQASYAAAKGGLIGLTRVLALEGASVGVRANAVMPFATTRMRATTQDDLEGRLNPAFVAPIVCWLAHPDCPTTGEIFSAGSGRVASVFLGETKGWRGGTLDAHTVEAVRDNFATILATDGFFVPRSFLDDKQAHLG